RDIIVVGASSGGVETLTTVVSGLPQDLNATLFVVLHVPARGESLLPQILSRAGKLPAEHARDNEPVQKGRIYVAPPDFQLLLQDRVARLVRGPKENNHRPAIDPTFRTAARVYGARVVGVVLSGALDDGTAGLAAVKRRGGIAVVQDPKDALFPDMPRSAMEAIDIDYCLPKTEIAALLVRLSQASVTADVAPPVREDLEMESAIEAMEVEALENGERPGIPSVFGCPDCGGVLWELQDRGLLRFRCRVGHAFGADGLLAAQSEGLDVALWTAFRSLEETAALARRLAARARKDQRTISARMFEKKAQRAERQAQVIRRALLHMKNDFPVDPPSKS
ncbi:MAG: chemotaxis protein CheB, partial [Candidatus Binatia bacterium]